MNRQEAITLAESWFNAKAWEAFAFQKQCWAAYLNGQNGLLNAPTGSGKTYAMGLGPLLEALLEKENKGKEAEGLQVVWITPIRALTKEIANALQIASDELGIGWKVGVRSGDTSQAERKQQKTQMPQVLITTPESLHVLMCSKGYAKVFKNLRLLVADEWHELMGSKRAVQVELALSRLKVISPKLRIWGISATIGNMQQALEVLLGDDVNKPYAVVKTDMRKRLEVETILPDEIERYPWAGHLGLQLLPKAIPIIENGGSTLIFTNTRGQSEIWYHRLLETYPDLAGSIAMHHGSISRELRDWVEEALHQGTLKAVVCTSSLDLGVDFRPVETVIQVGGPKAVARFVQRAGRSGHSPHALSKIYFLPTNSLELIEAAALRQAIEDNLLEDRIPYIRSFDVLLQYMITLAVSDGFRADELYQEIKTTFSYNSVSEEEWQWLLNFILYGGESLQAYDDYHKVVVEDGLFKVTNRRIASRHRMSIGTIVGDEMMQVKFMSGKRLGNIEERFIGRLQPGDTFWFAGRALEFVMVKENAALVRRSKATKGKIPSWMGGRLSFSSPMASVLRGKLNEAIYEKTTDIELKTIMPLLTKQQERSHVPALDEFLIEQIETREGYHLFMYPMEGRFVHEGIGSLVAYRIARIKPITFSIAMNDYGFELLADQEIPIEEALEAGLFSSKNLSADIQASINHIELARRKFRDIANISGLIFQGFPGRFKKEKYLQASAQLLFEVFREHDPNNLLYKQAFEEASFFQLEEIRMRQALERISQQKIVLTKPEQLTPFSFPLLVDRLRERMSNEQLSEQIKRMKVQLEKD